MGKVLTLLLFACTGLCLELFNDIVHSLASTIWAVRFTLDFVENFDVTPQCPNCGDSGLGFSDISHNFGYK